jgi:hypothetical protein
MTHLTPKRDSCHAHFECHSRITGFIGAEARPALSPRKRLRPHCR